MAISKHFSEQYQWWYFFNSETGETWWMEQPPEPEGPPPGANDPGCTASATSPTKAKEPIQRNSTEVALPKLRWFWVFPLPLLGLWHAVRAVKSGSLNPFYGLDYDAKEDVVWCWVAYTILWTGFYLISNLALNPYDGVARYVLTIAPSALLLSYPSNILLVWILRHLSQRTYQPRYEFKPAVFLGGIIGWIVTWVYFTYVPALIFGLPI